MIKHHLLVLLQVFIIPGISSNYMSGSPLCIVCDPTGGNPVSWANWGNWGPCINTGGIYAQTRVRGCDAVQCDQGLSQQSKACSPPPTPTPTWSAWSQWGACSSSCGNGYQLRQRVCDTQCGTCQCPGPSTEQRTCNQGPCCVWTDWSPWSQCSATCGSGGYRSRTRQCSCFSGCQGATSEQQTCSAGIPCETILPPTTCVACEQPVVVPVNPCVTCQVVNPCTNCGYYQYRRRREIQERKRRESSAGKTH